MWVPGVLWHNNESATGAAGTEQKEDNRVSVIRFQVEGSISIKISYGWKGTKLTRNTCGYPPDDGILRAKHTRCWDDSEREGRGREGQQGVCGAFYCVACLLPDGLAGSRGWVSLEGFVWMDGERSD